MYKIYNIPAQRYLRTAGVLWYPQTMDEPYVNTSPTGRVWKTRGSAINAFKKTLKEAKAAGLDTKDFRLDEVKEVVVHSILPHQV